MRAPKEQLATPLRGLPAITFDTQAAVALGLTPSGKVVWFGVARKSSEGVATIVRRDRIDTADAQGACPLRARP